MSVAKISLFEEEILSRTLSVGYHYIGQYSTAPIIGSLSQDYARKAAFAFVLVPTLIIGQYLARRPFVDRRN